MIKKTLKNVRRLKWFSFAMWLFANVLIVWGAVLAARGQFEMTAGVIYMVLSCLLWLFWFYGWEAFMDMEDEINGRKKTD